MISEAADEGMMRRIRSANRAWYFMTHGGVPAGDRFPGFDTESKAAPFPFIGMLQIIVPPSKTSPATRPETQP
jgi:hypothetical protein